MNMFNLQGAAQVLGGEVGGNNNIFCPGPGHSEKDRSMSVKLDANARDGFLVYSFAGDDPLRCRDYVRQRLGLPAFSPASRKRIFTSKK